MHRKSWLPRHCPKFSLCFTKLPNWLCCNILHSNFPFVPSFSPSDPLNHLKETGIFCCFVFYPCIKYHPTCSHSVPCGVEKWIFPRTKKEETFTHVSDPNLYEITSAQYNSVEDFICQLSVFHQQVLLILWEMQQRFKGKEIRLSYGNLFGWHFL